MESEINNLLPLIENDKHPFIVIMGGAKVDDKIKIIESLINKCDKLIITGGILNTFLKESGKNVGNSLVSDDEEVIASVNRVLKMYSDKLFFTNEFVVLRDNNVVKVKVDDIQDKDIIYDNIPNILSIINEGKIIFLNGTCGKYEDSLYEEGTLRLLKDLADTSADVYIGGGDTVTAVNKFGFANSYKYLSSGGGATLEYVAYNSLKAIDYIEKNEIDN